MAAAYGKPLQSKTCEQMDAIRRAADAEDERRRELKSERLQHLCGDPLVLSAVRSIQAFYRACALRARMGAVARMSDADAAVWRRERDAKVAETRRLLNVGKAEVAMVMKARVVHPVVPTEGEGRGVGRHG